MKKIAYFINYVIDNRDKDLSGIKEEVQKLCRDFPIYS